MTCRNAAVVAALTLLGVARPAGAQTPAHPLDPLTRHEHFAVLEVLDRAGKLTDDTRFTRVALKAPDKNLVWAWKSGTAFPRVAEAVVVQGAGVFEATVDLTAGELSAWRERPGVQSMFLGSDFGNAALKKALDDPRVKQALARRGVESTRFLDCLLLPPGNFGEARYSGRRIGQLECRVRSGYRNHYARRIEGLGVVVDLRSQEVLDVIDDDVVPVRPGGTDFDREAVGPLRDIKAPIEVRQPLGPGFSLDGHVVMWDRWRFHVRSDARVGTVISTVTWKDGERERPILYEGHLSEIFVPYMDPRRDWYTRTFIDAGEYSSRGLADSLSPGVDCPVNSAYVDMLVPAEKGWPGAKPNVACLFERASGDVLWRHGDEGRPSRELVVRMIATIGNYDYVIDWRFARDGQIRVSVGATGIVESKMSAQKDARTQGTNGNPSASRGDAYGRFVEPHVVAVNHDHYFNFRLDLDVDGPANRLVVDRLVPQPLADGHPRRSVWVIDSAPVLREQDGRLTMDMHKPALWRVTGTRQNAVGYLTSYQVMAGHSIHTLMSPDDFARRRAGFIDHHLWVTPFAPDERYAAGDFPTLSQPGEGLPDWTKANRAVADTDIVLWHTFGMHHMVRGEEWPVMPVLWHDFVLRPFDFHDRNPAVDVGLVP